jgi:hypothetical protein
MANTGSFRLTVHNNNNNDHLRNKNIVCPLSLSNQWTVHQNTVEACEVSEGVALFGTCTCGVRVVHVQLLNNKYYDQTFLFPQVTKELNEKLLTHSSTGVTCDLITVISGCCKCADIIIWYCVPGPVADVNLVDVLLVWLLEHQVNAIIPIDVEYGKSIEPVSILFSRC